MLLAARRGYAGCETLSISNWILRQVDQVGCVIFTQVDRIEAHLRAETNAAQRPESQTPD